MKHILGTDFTSDKPKAALLSRKAANPLADKLFDSSGMLEKLLAEADDSDFEDDQLCDVQAELKELRAQRRARQRSEAQAAQAAAPAAAASSSSSAGGPRPRRFVARPAQGYSREQAQECCPPSCRISKDDRRENRWRIRAEYLPVLGMGTGRSKSYGKGDTVSDYDAMVVVRTMAWRAYSLKYGGTCPFDFAQAPAR